VIAPGVAPPELKTSRAEARAALGLPAHAPIALFAGLIRDYKGLDLLLEAFSETAGRLPEALLLVAGLAAGRAQAPAVLGARGGPAMSWLRHEPGYLPRERFETCILAADVVVLPYRTSSTSAVLGEALAADRAVVVTRTGALPERIGENAAEMIVEPDNPRALARALERLLSDREHADRIGSAKGEELRRRFRWSVAAEKTIELYRTLLVDATADEEAGLVLEPRPA
jgi:glycosyltransferase involved in cell wall biosynthesis